MGYKVNTVNDDSLFMATSGMAFPFTMCAWIKTAGVQDGVRPLACYVFNSTVIVAIAGGSRLVDLWLSMNNALPNAELPMFDDVWLPVVIVATDPNNGLIRFNGAEDTGAGSGSTDKASTFNRIEIGSYTTFSSIALGTLGTFAAPTIWNAAFDLGERELLDTIDPGTYRVEDQKFHATLKLGDTLEDVITSTALTHRGAGTIVEDHPVFAAGGGGGGPSYGYRSYGYGGY